jgi:predicted RNA-binding protein YlxR (DUF448 family)
MMTPHETHHQRTCVGCAKKDAPEAMVRLVVGSDGDIAVDAAGGAFGRGAHVHPFGDCVERACRGGLSKAFKQEIKIGADVLRARMREAHTRRIAGILLGARRAGHLALGADAVGQAKDATLIILAADAGSVASRFERAIATGKARCFGTKAELGALLGTGETAVFAVCHDGVARALQHALAISEER